MTAAGCGIRPRRYRKLLAAAVDETKRLIDRYRHQGQRGQDGNPAHVRTGLAMNAATSPGSRSARLVADKTGLFPRRDITSEPARPNNAKASRNIAMIAALPWRLGGGRR